MRKYGKRKEKKCDTRRRIKYIEVNQDCSGTEKKKWEKINSIFYEVRGCLCPSIFLMNLCDTMALSYYVNPPSNVVKTYV